ncbi:MAG: hypothetical protein ACRDRA_04015 [Pseudonocardiaceae bacterium]
MSDEHEDSNSRRMPAQDLPADAGQELDRVMQLLSQRVVDEAGRLAAERAEGSGPEPITPADIRRGARYVQGGPGVSRLSMRERAYQGASYLGAIVAGYFANNIDKAWGAIGFTVVASIGILAYALGIEERRSRR